MLTDIPIPNILFTISHDNIADSFQLLVLCLQQFNIIKELIFISFLWGSWN